MKTLIKHSKIFSPKSTYHNSTGDILLENGSIKEIAPSIKKTADKIVSGKNLVTSSGYFDLRSVSKDPGFEGMDTLETLSKDASSGGFTHISILPNTEPVISSKESLHYFHQFSNDTLVQILPIAAVTKKCEGIDFTEMWDLHNHGAVAFSDGLKSVWNADIFLKTLQYLAPKGALLINTPVEPTLSLYGQMHEGETSVMLGLKGIPSAAEEVMLQRDLKLLEYCSIKSNKPVLHFSGISSAEGVALIRKAKEQGLPISADVHYLNLCFTDKDLMSFDTNLKQDPPLRSSKDQKALLKGLKDGTLDAISSFHHPLDTEHKMCEFDQASPGSLGLNTLLPALLTYTKLPLETILEKIAIAPYAIMRKEIRPIALDAEANLTVLDLEEETHLEEKSIFSASKNSPFLGQTLKGKIMAVFNNQKAFFA